MMRDIAAKQSTCVLATGEISPDFVGVNNLELECMLLDGDQLDS
ncbi:unnamed protein product, partial [Cuscuta epithymum]